MQLQLLHYITRHSTTLHDTNYITLRYIYSCNCNYKYNYHYIALRYTPLITLHYNYNCTTLHYTAPDHPTETTLQHTPLQYTTIYYTKYTTPQLQLQLQLQLHYTHYITLDCNQSKKHSSNHLLVHQWFRSAIRGSQQPTSPIGFIFLKLLPLPCAAQCNWV